MSEKLFKTQTDNPHLLTDVIKDQVFTWNKYSQDSDVSNFIGSD